MMNTISRSFRLATLFCKIVFLTCSCAFFSASFSACQNTLLEDETTIEVWKISPKTQKREYIPVFGDKTEVECMVITSLSPFRSEPFYIRLNEILGFNYQTGYEYKVNVKVVKLANPPQDDGDRIFSLERILSKKQRLASD